jgi:tRNA-guanine family transglycosylase
MLGPILATQHNLHFYADTMRAARTAILAGSFDSWKRSFVDRFERGGAGAASDFGKEKQRRIS